MTPISIFFKRIWLQKDGYHQILFLTIYFENGGLEKYYTSCVHTSFLSACLVNQGITPKTTNVSNSKEGAFFKNVISPKVIFEKSKKNCLEWVCINIFSLCHCKIKPSYTDTHGSLKIKNYELYKVLRK